MLNDLSSDELISRERALLERFAIHKEAGLALDLTRGKPSPEQLSLSDELDAMVGDEFRASDGTDLRNYGGLTGMSEARELGAELLGIGAEDVIAGGNSSLTLMYQYLLHAWLHGPLDAKTAWRLEPGPTKFLCVVPGYDRHFTIVESLGFELGRHCDRCTLTDLPDSTLQDPRFDRDVFPHETDSVENAAGSVLHG